jgi:tetratricopeptide (TPR) repeat protein
MSSMSDASLRMSEPEIVLSPSAQDVQIVSASSASVAVVEAQLGEENVEEVYPEELSYEDDDGGETLFNRKEPAFAKEQVPAAAPPRRVSVAPPAPPYQPPAPVGRGNGPAYELDTDEDEDQLQREGSFGALLDLYRLRAADADTPLTRAALLHKIASVHEFKLQAPEQAFTAISEAFDLRPGDDDIVASLDRIAREAGRVGELADRARKNLHTADLELKVILLGHLVYWYERVLGRSQEMSPFLSELERLDKTHPVTLRRQAQLAAAAGDTKSQRELLIRALDRTSRRDEKVHLHIALASAYAGTPEALRHYEAAVANDASSVVALQGLERIGREQGKHAQVEWCLERQVEVALTGAERIDALLKLAELHETKFLKRERAAEVLERIVAEEPAHPQALKALERCYHALRAWPQLAKVLRARADNTYDKKQKTELLELAAEVFESKLGDPAAAIEVHRDLLVVDPTHRRALADLARLYEKLGDWSNMSTYKARVAELSSSKRQASQLLVQLGDFLSAPDRDAIIARLQYERAVSVDPTNAAAWEALQRVASAAGDDRRVAECLEQRARNVDAPRQRAAIFVELANLHLGNGADRAAREAFEAATSADPTNEAAAVAMLDVFTREEKWAKAAPLCELLVNAAKRDSDARALFTRLRLATRISAALGDAERAMTSSLAAIELHPDDGGAQADLIAVCNQCRTQPKVIARAKDWLTRLAEGAAALPAGVRVALAQIQRSANDIDAAAHTLEQALRADPDTPEVLKELADVYLAQGDFARCCKLKVDMARNATSADVRFQLLCEAADIWAKRAEELDKAATIYEEARLIKPLDNGLLHTLLWLYGERHRWDDLSNVLESIAQLHEAPEKKAKSFFAMAQVVLEKVGDPIRAASLFDQVLDIDKKRLDAFEQLVRALTEAKDWEFLERSYRKMIARTKDDPEPNMNLQFALFHQLGLIYRDRLDDAEHAYEALEAAARIRPDDAGVRKIVTELLVVTDNLDAAVSRTRELIVRDPHDAELYVELYELFLRQHAFDKAWCAVNVLAQMREPSAEQRRFHEDYAPMPLADVPGQIVEQAWGSHVLHSDLDPTLTTVFSRMTPAVARMRYAQLRPEQLMHAAGRPFTGAHSRLYEAVRITFANAAEILHMTPPELLLGDPSSTAPFAPAFAPFGAVLVGVPAVEARADALVYVIGKRLAEQRPELLARAFFPAVSDLTSLLAAAVRVSRQEGAKDAAGAALDASLNAVLMPQEREGIRAVVMQAQLVGGLVDVKRWSQAADLSSMRAGLLLCGDVGPARRAILGEPQSPADLPPREKIGELYKFATSDLYADLRGAIGTAVQG